MKVGFIKPAKSLFAALLLVISLVTPLLLTTPATALSGSEFNAGNIIDDATFFTPEAMDIQGFLVARVPVCDTWGTQLHSSGQTRAAYSAARGVATPFTCLKDYSENVPFRSPETGLCNGMGPGTKSSATIIYEVSQSCGINPRVLITLLQKEQSLVTDDWPWPVQYRSATGYGCPDTAPCDSDYYGFFNQVYNAARQFKRYAKDSSLFNYQAGRASSIPWNPNGACGNSIVYIENQATAGLYNYTPYRPNQAALNNLYGTGDSCSSYGNRNFWRMYNDWFGITYSGAIGNSAYQMYNPGHRGHYYPANENWRANAKKYGYVDDGTAFNVSPTQQAGMIPIYTLFNGRMSDFWLVPDGMSRYWGIVHGGYREDGLAFYAYPTNAAGSPTACSQGTPVYQLWHGGNTDHYYTTVGGNRYWSLIFGGYVDDRSSVYGDPNNGYVAFCAP